MVNVLYQDNHIILVNKPVGQIVQSGKEESNFVNPSLEKVVKQYLQQSLNKSGDAFLGIPHRLDCPVSGLVIMAKTSKALIRLNRMFQSKEIQKKYHAIVKNKPPMDQEILTHYLSRNEKTNRSHIALPTNKNAKLAQLKYRVIGQSNNYFLLEIELLTGRHHQIRAQLSAIGSPIKGDLKYGFTRSNPHGGISLHAHRVIFSHPVSKSTIDITAPYFTEDIWNEFSIKPDKHSIEALKINKRTPYE